MPEPIEHLLALSLSKCELQEWFMVTIYHGDGDGGILDDPAPQIVGYSENRLVAKLYGDLIIKRDISCPLLQRVSNTEVWSSVTSVVVLVSNNLGYPVGNTSVGPMIDNDEVIRITQKLSLRKLTSSEQAVLGLSGQDR